MEIRYRYPLDGEEAVSDWRASKPIPGFPGYLVSPTGRVFNKHGALLSPHNNRGYRMLAIRSESGKRHATSVHRLVVLAHIGTIPKGMWVNHKNGIKHDNRVENLELTTPAENLIHAYRVLKCNRASGESVHTSKLTPDDVAAIRASTLSQRQLGLQFGVSQVAIHNIKTHKAWK